LSKFATGFGRTIANFCRTSVLITIFVGPLFLPAGTSSSDSCRVVKHSNRIETSFPGTLNVPASGRHFPCHAHCNLNASAKIRLIALKRLSSSLQTNTDSTVAPAFLQAPVNVPLFFDLTTFYHCGQIANSPGQSQKKPTGPSPRHLARRSSPRVHAMTFYRRAVVAAVAACLVCGLVRAPRRRAPCTASSTHLIEIPRSSTRPRARGDPDLWAPWCSCPEHRPRETTRLPRALSLNSAFAAVAGWGKTRLEHAQRRLPRSTSTRPTSASQRLIGPTVTHPHGG